jgi:hypothetical protein
MARVYIAMHQTNASFEHLPFAHDAPHNVTAQVISHLSLCDVSIVKDLPVRVQESWQAGS